MRHILILGCLYRLLKILLKLEQVDLTLQFCHKIADRMVKVVDPDHAVPSVKTASLTLLHSEWPKLYSILAFLSAVGLRKEQSDLGLLYLCMHFCPNIRIDIVVYNYTPGIYAKGYIVFAFPFVHSYVHSFVCSFVHSFVTFRHVHRICLKVFG